MWIYRRTVNIYINIYKRFYLFCTVVTFHYQSAGFSQMLGILITTLLYTQHKYVRSVSWEFKNVSYYMALGNDRAILGSIRDMRFHIMNS